jgi:hypothetical protein
MESNEERRYEGLSPFELKNRLVALAKQRASATAASPPIPRA